MVMEDLASQLGTRRERERYLPPFPTLDYQQLTDYDHFLFELNQSLECRKKFYRQFRHLRFLFAFFEFECRSVGPVSEKKFRHSIS